MLRTIAIECPVCHEPTEVSVVVADPAQDDPGVATSSCRRCRAPFVNLTLQDGTVAVLDGAPDSTDEDAPRVLAVIPPIDRPGHALRPPARVGILERGLAPYRQPAGVPDAELDGVVEFGPGRSYLYRPDGSRRSDAELMATVGDRSLWVAQLSDAVGRRLAAPPPISSPPWVFVSYRWGSPVANQWVADLASELVRRGYPVVFDRDQPTDITVPELVSKVADCRYFVAVLDAGYAERIGRADRGSIADGWVWDELQTAVALQRRGQIGIVGLLREDVDLPNGFAFARPGREGNAIDVREPGRLTAVVDEIFPAVEGGPSPTSARRAASLIRESYEEQCAGRFDAAFALAQEATDLLPGIIDGIAQKIRVAYAAGAAGIGLAATEEALALDPTSPELLLLGGSFAADGHEPKRAVELLARLLEAPGGTTAAELASAQVALGSALDDLDEVDAALAHLANACTAARPDSLLTLGYVLRRAGRPGDAAATLRTGLDLLPGDARFVVGLTAALAEDGRLDEARAALDELAVAGHHDEQVNAMIAVLDAAAAAGVAPLLIERVASTGGTARAVCSECPAEIPVDDHGALCARCGVAVTPEERWCHCCSSDGRVIVADGPFAFRCPFCRRGTIRRAPRG